jgi:hypothetical protein
MINTSQIAQNVRRNLDDLGANFYDTNVDIIPSIRDGYSLTAAFCETIESRQDINFTGELVVYDFSALLTNYLRVYGIYNNETNRWMEPTTLLRLWQIRDDWELCNGQPYMFWPISYKHVALFPVPATSTGSMTVMFKAKGATLSSNSTPVLPESNVDVLEDFATADLLTQCEEFTKALKWAGLYEQHINDICRIVRDRSRPNQLYYHGEVF